MSSIYKIELNVVSDWIKFDEKEIASKIIKQINKDKELRLSGKLSVSEIKNLGSI